jgi:hypothetical protein
MGTQTAAIARNGPDASETQSPFIANNAINE